MLTQLFTYLWVVKKQSKSTLQIDIAIITCFTLIIGIDSMIFTDYLFINNKYSNNLIFFEKKSINVIRQLKCKMADF